MKINILAFGDRFASSYQSLEHELVKHGNISYHREKDFANVDAAINYIRNSSFNAVVMPNPYGNERRMYIYKKLKLLKFPVIVFDRGALPDSWFFDLGFNADSETYHPLNWDYVLEDNKEKEIIDYIEKIKKGDNALEKQGERVGAERLKSELGIEDKKVIFVPFQRPEDTVIKHFSDGYDEFVREIEELNKYINKHLHDEWIVIAKKHPLEMLRPSENITFVDDDINIYDLIEMSEMVVLINSGVGLLSMLWEKPVLHFGKTFYSHPKLNTKVESHKDILYYMSQPLAVDKNKMIRYIRYLKEDVYSFAEFETERVLQKDKSYRNITKYINFTQVNFPNIENILKKKILLITQVIPWPINRGSAQRTDQMIRSLLENDYSVDVIVSNLSERGITSSDIEDRLSKRYRGANFIVRKHPSLLDKSKKGTKERKLYYLYLLTLMYDYMSFNKFKVFSFRLMPYNIRKLVDKKLASGMYDIYYSNYLYNVPSNIKNHNVEVVSDIHDLQYRRIENDVIPAVGKFQALLYKIFYKSSELKRLNLVDKIISISPIETKLIQKVMPNKNIVTIPATADANNNFIDKVDQKYDITFIGSNSDANRDSLLWFLNECYPYIIKNNSNIKFLIQGKITRNKLIKNNAIFKNNLNKSIIASDYVEYLSDVYSDTKVIICPIIKGSGMKIKVIEALSFAKAIVGTDIAFEGINIENDEEGIVANDSNEFAREVLGLISNEKQRNNMQISAYELFKSEHSFDSCVIEMSKVLI